MDLENDPRKAAPEKDLTTESTTKANSTKNQVVSDTEARRREASKLRARRNRKRKKEESINLENHVQTLTVRNMDLERQIEVMKVQLIGAEERIKTLEKLLSDTLRGVSYRTDMFVYLLTRSDINFNSSILQSKPQTLHPIGSNTFPDSMNYHGNFGLNINQYCGQMYPMNGGAYSTVNIGNTLPSGFTSLGAFAGLSRNEILMQALMDQYPQLAQQRLDQAYSDDKHREKQT